jgi:hypothetical protein
LYAAFISSGLQAATVVVGQPPLTATGNCDPFGCPALFGLGTYQQVYASTAFSSPLTIVTVSFEDTQVHNGGSQALGTFTLSFAYTSKEPGMLDLTNPSNNITSGSQTFYTGTLPNLATGTSGAPSLIISGTPFAYNPANGNLLLTVVVSAPSDQLTILYLDEAATTGVTTNAYFGVLDGVRVSGGNDAGGLVTEFASSSLQITGPASLATGAVGVAYGPVTFTATGGVGGYSWSATGLPNGLSVSAGGVLSGTPAVDSQGAYSPQFTVTDSSDDTASVTLPLRINASLQITGPSSLPIGAVGRAYPSVTFTAAGGTGGDVWSATGLPKGLLFSAGGVLSGTPAAGTLGVYLPHFTVTDSAGSQAEVIGLLGIIPKL